MAHQYVGWVTALTTVIAVMPQFCRVRVPGLGKGQFGGKAHPFAAVHIPGPQLVFRSKDDRQRDCSSGTDRRSRMQDASLTQFCENSDPAP